MRFTTQSSNKFNRYEVDWSQRGNVEGMVSLYSEPILIMGKRRSFFNSTQRGW
ncbi:UNVERIFIED_CONTAM: hypothetical protein FKN15_045143 [Acipenser sinensis]